LIDFGLADAGFGPLREGLEAQSHDGGVYLPDSSSLYQMRSNSKQFFPFPFQPEARRADMCAVGLRSIDSRMI